MPLKQLDGMPIIDAKRPLTLNIKVPDIEKADPKEPLDCVVARACRRQLHVKEARIHLNRVYLRSNNGNWVRYEAPRSLRAEIIAFDRGGTFEPGDFELKPPRVRTTGKRQGGKSRFKHARNNPNHVPRPRHIVTNVRHGPA